MRLCVLVCVAILAGGCAGRRVPSPVPDQAHTDRRSASSPDGDSLQTFMSKVRELSAQARPERVSPPTIEARDPALKNALAVSLILPNADAFRAVAVEYQRLGVFDKAHAYLTKALAFAPQDSASYDAIAVQLRYARIVHSDIEKALFQYRPGRFPQSSSCVCNRCK